MKANINFDKLLVFDCEVFRNYFLVSFKSLTTGVCFSIEMGGEGSEGENKRLSPQDRANLKELIYNRSTFGFNSTGYDMVVVELALAGKTCYEIYQMSMKLVHTNDRLELWKIINSVLQNSLVDRSHFDVQSSGPPRKSLKKLAVNLHAKSLIELPFHPNKLLKLEEMKTIKEYCENDLDVTIKLYEKVKDKVHLRLVMSERYNMNFLNYDEPKIAENFIVHQIEKEVSRKIPKPSVSIEELLKRKLTYSKPDFIQLNSTGFKQAESLATSHTFTLSKKGKIVPRKLNVTYKGKEYTFSSGGLHSTKTHTNYVCKKGEKIIEVDVTSFYPNIIINKGLYPAHLGKPFLNVYKKIVDQRVEAKNKGDKITSDILKIVINSSYGKFAQHYSKLYQPEALLYVVLTGQLSLMMLIEMLGERDIETLYANTDGIYTLVKESKLDEFNAICKQWEERTNLTLEHNEYRSIYMASVNAYIAFADGYYKAVGKYKYSKLGSSLHGDILVDCVINYLRDNKPTMETLKECKDIRKFLISASSKKDKGGVITWKGEPVGLTVRYYYSSNEKGCLQTMKKGDKVPDSESAKPLMVLPDEFPNDIDYERYKRLVSNRLRELGLADDSEQMSLGIER